MLHLKLLEKIYSLSLKKGKLLLIIMGVVTIVSALFIPTLKISSSHSDLIPKDDPEQAKLIKFTKEFGASDYLVVVLEGETELLKASADLFIDEIEKEKRWVKSIFSKIDTQLLIDRAPLFAELEYLKKSINIAKKEKNIIKKIPTLNNLMSLLTEMRKGLLTRASDVDAEIADDLIKGLNMFFDEWSYWIKDSSHNSIEMMDKFFSPGTEIEGVFKSEGFLFSRDYKMLFLFVQPTSSDDDISYLKPFTRDIKQACNTVFENHPKLKNNIKVSFTGMPAHILTENQTIFEDIRWAGSISIFVVIIILLWGFKSIRKMIMGIVPLTCGMVITLGLVSIILGKLNLISSSFLAVLFGIGIDFGIYLIRRTEEELGNNISNEEAVHRAVVITGKGIVTGGFTTALAFFAISFSKFSGYSELGTTAGIGVLVMMFTTFLMMPPLLLLVKIEPRHYDPKYETSPLLESGHKRRLLYVFIPTIIFTIFSIISIFFNEFDYNALKLLPKKTESTEYQVKMEENSDFKMSSAYITANSLDELRELTKKIKKLPTVSRVDSLAEMIPEDQEEKLKVIGEYKKMLRGLSIPLIVKNRNPHEFSKILETMLPYFEESQEKAFAAGHKNLVKDLDKLINSISDISDYLSGKNKKLALIRTRAFERELFTHIRKMTQQLNIWLNATKITEDSFSPKMINRFKSSKGNYVAYVFPNGSIWEVKFLDKFVNSLKKISKGVTGFPITHKVYVRQAADAVLEAIVYALVIVIFILLIDFRRIDAALLALVPLALGLLWMQGCLYIANVPYNLANIAGLPLLLGLGVVYGVHVIHRWRENPELSAFAVTQTTGRGISFAAFTTISGLCSIVFARHGGVSTFGLLILFGISLCLITALFILPAIIDLIYLRKREEK